MGMSDLWLTIIRAVVISLVGTALAAWALSKRGRPPQ